MQPNRIVALAAALLGLVAAVAVPLANLDWSSTAGVIAGLGAVALTALKWLDGWQAHEDRVARSALEGDEQGDDEHPFVFGIAQTDPSKVPHDEGDPGKPTANPVRPPARKRPARAKAGVKK